MGLECSGVYQQSFTFWIVTLQPLRAYRSTIPQMKGNMHTFHMRYGSMICSKRLQKYRTNPSLRLSSLVLLNRSPTWFENLEQSISVNSPISTLVNIEFNL